MLNRLDLYIYKKRAAYRKRMRLLFPSPAEVRFIQLMGGHCTTIKFLRYGPNHFPLVLVWSLGKVLERERIQREVRAGAMFIDFGVVTPYYKRGIEIDGRDFHRDVIKERERDVYVANHGGWKLLHVQADILYREPYRVQNAVLEWLQN